MDENNYEKARGMAQLLLDSGLGFDRIGYRRGRGLLGRNAKDRRKAYPIGVYSYDEARELGLKPSADLQDAMRDMLLVRHAEFQAERKKVNSERAKFYSSRTWLTIRYQILSERGGRCECCGASAADGVKLHVDHIKPRSKYPELALEKSNLQVLCRACNVGKSDKLEDDWRHKRASRRLISGKITE